MGPRDESELPTDVDLQTFREAVENAGHAIYWTDTNGTIEYVNAAFEEQTGFTADEAVGSNANILQSGVHNDRFYERLWDTILSGEIWNGTIVNKRKNGEQYIVKQTISPITDEEGGIVRFVAINEDITDLREYQEELEQERDRFRNLLNAVPVPLVLVAFEDGQAVVEQINEAFRTEFGFSDRELLGASLDERIVDDERVESARAINERIERGERVREEVIRLTADGEERRYLLTARPLSDDDAVESLGTYIDITDRKRAEEQLKQKNEQLEEFANVISHDLRNPLNVAMGHVDLATETCDSPHLETVRQSHRRMQELIDNILTLARKGHDIDDPEPVDLRACVAASWETVVTREAELHNETSGTIMADESRLRQLFGNLFRNALDHGEPDVTVTVGDLQTGFYVADTGPGIPEAERERIFESGYTTSGSGTGFGLSIVQEITDAHDWSVAVTESDSGGARFEITGVNVIDE